MKACLAALAALLACSLAAPAAARQSRASDRSGDRPNFSGEWTLNRELSDEPRRDDGQGDDRRGGGRRGGYGGRGGFGRGGGFGGRYGGARPAGDQGAADRATIQTAIDEARSPSPSLTISHSAANIAITDAKDRTRFFQTSGAKDKHQLGEATIDSTTSWTGGDLVIQYDLGNGRHLTYTYSLAPATKQLVVRVRIDGSQYGSRGPSTIKYVYDHAHAR